MTQDIATVAFVPATRVAEAARLSFLPAQFGAQMMSVENAVFAWGRRLLVGYTGGMWDFFTLPEAGGFLAPAGGEPSVRIEVATNGFAGEMSREAAGIVITLFALSALANRTRSEALVDRYWQLLDWAGGHPECGQILRAID